MSNALSIIRALIIYGLCLPLAIFLGYLVPTTTMDMSSFMVVLLVLLLLLAPVMLRWHHPLLIASWNMNVVIFFLPGRPSLWIVMSAASLLLSILQRILNRELKFLSAPTVARPLIFLAVVIVGTAMLTGGMGFQSFGGGAFGGRRYVWLLGAIIGYFALTCRPIPPERAILYVSLFFLCGLTIGIANLGPLVDPSLHFIFAIFPPDSIQSLMAEGLSASDDPFARLSGFSLAGLAVVAFLLARHGMRGVLSLNERWHFLPFQFRGGVGIHQPWRVLLLLLCVWISLLGGFRTMAICLALTMLCQFYFEGLFRSRLFPFMVVAVMVTGIVSVSVVDKLPFAVQRSLSFLPLDVDPVARYAAEASTEWRLKIWRSLLPEVPKYLFLGKGYAINPAELEMAGAARFSQTTTSQDVAIVAGDYHSGPLSLLIPLGIYGAIGFIWFLAASIRVLRRNLKFGDPGLRAVNSFLLSYFIARAVLFFFVFGSLYVDLVFFTGLVGLSISVNGGVRGPVPVEATKPVVNEFRLARVTR